MLFAPLNVAAFMHIPRELRGAAVGLLALLRNEGGSVGTSVAQTIQERREQFHLLRLGENLDMLNPAVNGFLANAGPAFVQQTADPVGAKLMALQALDDLRQQQASTLAYFDTFVVFAALSFVLVFTVFLMRRSVARRGARRGGVGPGQHRQGSENHVNAARVEQDRQNYEKLMAGRSDANFSFDDLRSSSKGSVTSSATGKPSGCPEGDEFPEFAGEKRKSQTVPSGHS